MPVCCDQADPPRQVFIVHGEPNASDALRFAIEERFGWEVRVPEQGEAFTLDGGGPA